MVTAEQHFQLQITHRDSQNSSQNKKTKEDARIVEMCSMCVDNSHKAKL